MEDKIKCFKDLKVWQRSIELVKDVYRITKYLPKDELYTLVSQMRRAAISIPSNIAEGFRRKHNKEYKQFLNIALGSCAELETQVIIAKELGYVKQDDFEAVSEIIDHICRMTMNLIKKL